MIIFLGVKLVQLMLSKLLKKTYTVAIKESELHV